MKIIYRKMQFTFEIEPGSCWYDIDGKHSETNGKRIVINADRDVYANFTDGDKIIEGYIVSLDDLKNPIPDNFPIDEEVYKFKKLRKPGYYL